MFKIKDYVMVKDLEEAYQLNQKRSGVILGGTGWLKLGNKQIGTAIDLSGLGLNKIDENEEEFRIGCMTTLRDLELHNGLNEHFKGAIKESVKHIVGVQFRNCATIGGSIYARFGFSDILTCLLALDSYVELYNKGILPLHEFVRMPYDNDVLVRIIIKKDGRDVVYQSKRASATDIPVLACAVAKKDNTFYISVGARPKRAVLQTIECTFGPSEEEKISVLAIKLCENLEFDSNMRGSKEYRHHLATVFVKRGILALLGGNYTC